MTSITQNIRVGVVIVNWRGSDDTILSLSALYGGPFRDFDVVVVDNASNDGSIQRIQQWSAGSVEAVLPKLLQDKILAVPLPTDRLFRVVSGSTAAAGTVDTAGLTVIQADKNGGFASGNNIGLRFLKKSGLYSHYWLLNNDAFPDPIALKELVEYSATHPAFGQIGSTLVFATRPRVVQALGGATYDPRTGRAHHLGAEMPLDNILSIDVSDIESRMSYVVGASILLTDEFLSSVGEMEESYFLYFEELDWAERGKERFGLGYARNSLVYHKAGGSTQTRSQRSVLAAYFLARNRLVVTRKFFPQHIRTVRFELAIETLKSAIRGRWSEAKGYAKACVTIM